MQYTTSFGAFLVGLLTLSDAAAAIPTRQSAPLKSSPRGTSVKQVRNSGYNAKYSRHGALALEKVYLKFNTAMPAELTTAVSRVRTTFRAALAALDVDGDGFDIAINPNQKRATGSAVATPEDYDVEYLTPIQIGTPAQTLNLDFDTGSSDLWVYSSETPAGEVSGQSIYTPNASTTSVKKEGLSWSISYGDGSNSKGDVYYDKVSVGGLTVAKMAVEVATEVSAEFTADTEIDGLLGLGFTALNTVSPTAEKTFFDKAEDQLDEFLFTVDLKAGEPGTYNFGYIDDSLYTGDLTYTAVDSEAGYWLFSSTGYAIGGNAFNETTITGIADTGTTLLMLPTAIVDAYYAQINGSSYDTTNSGYIFPCTETPPDFTIGIEAGGRIVVPGSFINYSPIDSAGRNCYGGIQDDADIGFAIFGDIALKAAFVVFEGGDVPRLGWANKNL